MNRDLEIRIGTKIDVALGRIQSKVVLTGMAASWHVGKASDIVRDPTLLDRHVVRLDEHGEAKYLDRLPTLIVLTEEQDRRCELQWLDDRHNSDSFLRARDELVSLLSQFLIRPKLYERLVRQPDKPLLDEAKQAARCGGVTMSGAIRIEALVRMQIGDFIASEESLARDLLDLDNLRQELCDAHYEWAVQLAAARKSGDLSAVSSARIGLQRAAEWYDFKEGYSFEDYAQHWVEEAIDKQRE